MFAEHLDRWGLTPDGAPIVTRSGRLLPVRQGEVPAMLKLASAEEGGAGAALMSWWNGDGAARVLATSGDALLLERAQGHRSLADMATSGQDDEASRLICGVVAKLHARRGDPPPGLVPLNRWFRELEPAAARRGGILTRAAAAARELLAAPQNNRALHGDIHHDNILDFGEGGWRAIDPKGLIGERGFDYANMFCNPNHDIATEQGRLARRAAIVCEASGLSRERLLQWVLAYAGLSAAWLISDGEDPQLPLAVAEAAAELVPH
ncbi:MAG TPA: aminoglycoside phosphotransferase family protein [Methylocystis sp.]|nr:aminoglycoside phosphotransferase family protein [Methylocystis sp.]